LDLVVGWLPIGNPLAAWSDSGRRESQGIVDSEILGFRFSIPRRRGGAVTADQESPVENRKTP